MVRASASFSSDDERHMKRALALAERARGRTAPNPMVGCVLVRNGGVVGEGYHHRAGLPHAEALALRAAGGRARGATAYVSLEPCNHHGRTGPCTEALIAAGIVRVVGAVGDPNPIAGGGFARLRAAGVRVELGLCAEEAAAKNAAFFRWIVDGRPRVTLKAALSLDGRIAGRHPARTAGRREADWLTGPEARVEAHRLRDRSDAILIGAGTVRDDDPALTTRLPGGRGRDPRIVVLDGRLAIAPRSRVVRPGTLILATQQASRAAEARLTARGAEVIRLPSRGPAFELPGALVELGRRGVLDLLVEGGAATFGGFLAAGLVDRLVLFVAPRLLGGSAVPFLAAPLADSVAAAPRLRLVSTKRLGADIMLVAELDGGAPRR